MCVEGVPDYKVYIYEPNFCFCFIPVQMYIFIMFTHVLSQKIKKENN